MVITEMTLVGKMPGTLKSPVTKYVKPREGEVEPRKVTVVAFEIPEMDEETANVLALFAHQGHAVQVTVTAQQSTFDRA